MRRACNPLVDVQRHQALFEVLSFSSAIVAVTWTHSSSL